MKHSMKLKTLVTVAFLTFCYNTWGQDSLNYHGQPFIIRHAPSNVKIEPPLYIIKADSKICQVPASGRFSNTRQVKRTFKKFNVDSVQSIEILKEKNATDKYGTLGQYGAIIINMKNGTYDMLSRKIKRGCR